MNATNTKSAASTSFTKARLTDRRTDLAFAIAHSRISHVGTFLTRKEAKSILARARTGGLSITEQHSIRKELNSGRPMTVEARKELKVALAVARLSSGGFDPR